MEDARKKYADIIEHEHHVSAKHPRMSRLNRAAQFAPFAALTGYDDLIVETARETQTRVKLDESEKGELNKKLVYLLEHSEVAARFKYFVQDRWKSGGEYLSARGRVVGYSELGRCIYLDDGTTLFIDDIAGIDTDDVPE
ncbi:MAG: hypothetical protein IJG63_02685 [Oscillospiraceae bacterium]|nr:hypothetical protein [Oscillospiraceae bacterium]